MAISCTSWFQSQLEQPTSSPVRVLYVGNSDYSDRVLKWPKIKRTSEELQSVQVSIQLANHDQAMNDFYRLVYTVQASCHLSLGFTHPTSGTETVTLFRGKLNSVRFTDDSKCELRIRDKLFDFYQKEAGASTSGSQINITSQYPANVAWYVCCSFGGLSSVASTSNPDIDYEKHDQWYDQFVADTVRIASHHEGEKVTEALSEILKMSDSACYVNGDGKLCFFRFSEPSSLDYCYTRDTLKSLQIDVETLRVVNQQIVNFDFNPSDGTWARSLIWQSSTSVNTYGLRQETAESEVCWFCDSASALNLAQRRIIRFQYPPRRFKAVVRGLSGLHREVGETIRLVNSFFDITSAGGWRATEQEIDMDRGLLTWTLDEAAMGTPATFYLDVSLLDGDDLLL